MVARKLPCIEPGDRQNKAILESAWLAIAVLGGIVWGAAMLIWMWLLDKLELGQISVSVYMLPVFGVLLSAVTLRE